MEPLDHREKASPNATTGRIRRRTIWAGYSSDASPSEFLLRPPGRVFHIALLALMAWTLWSVSVPGWYFRSSVIAFALWILAATTWSVRITARNLLLWRGASDPHPHRWRAWSVAPTLAASTLAVVFFGWPLQLRFEFSRLALERSAIETMALPSFADDWSSSDDLRIGLFDVHFRDAMPGGVRFWLDGAGFVDPVGLAYAPRGVPPDGSGGRYWELEDAWYGFSVDF